MSQKNVRVTTNRNGTERITIIKITTFYAKLQKGKERKLETAVDEKQLTGRYFNNRKLQRKTQHSQIKNEAGQKE